MVDRGRSPIRPTPSSSAVPREEITDPVEAKHELDIETASLAERELARLLEEDDLEFGCTTVQIDARELDVLLEQARPGAPPPSRRSLTTQPYDEVTAHALLDEDGTPPAGTGAVVDAPVDDAPVIEAVVDTDDANEPEPIEAVVAAAPSPPIVAPAPVPSTPPASAPPPAAIAPAAARASLPSAGMEWPGQQDRKRRTRMVIAAVAGLATITILYLALTEPEPAPIAPTPAAVAPPPPAPPAPSAPKPQSLAEIDARKALSRLREGMGDCVRKAIGSLPGSSPAVPPAIKQTSGVGYTALPADWKTAVWSCAKFRHDAPMAFQLQWQSVKPGVEAVGLAWIDDDSDGEPDRALGFRATAKGTRDVELGEIAPMEMRPVLPVR